jgi:two-component system sensor histidine kinase/response regulator
VAQQEQSEEKPESPSPRPQPLPTGADGGYVGRMLSSLSVQYELNREEAMPLIHSLAETLTGHHHGLRECLPLSEADRLLHHAHGIKGLLLNMGLTEEGLAAKELEESARAGAAPEELRQGAETLLLLTGSILDELHIALGGEHT